MANWDLVESILVSSTRNNPANNIFDLNQELKSSLCLKFGEDNGNVRLPSTAHEVMDLLDILLSEEQPAKAAE